MYSFLQNFSIAIDVPDEQNEVIRSLKQQLFAATGKRFASVNSRGHVSLFTFNLFLYSLKEVEEYLARIAAELDSFDLAYDGFDSFQQRSLTYYINPVDETAETIRKIGNRLHERLRNSRIFHNLLDFKAYYYSPHITVGRQLSPQMLALAYRSLKEVSGQFRCADIVLRRYNPNIGQFEIIARFPLRGQRRPVPTQMILFPRR